MATNAKDITGRTFGWLTAVKPSGERSKRGDVLTWCRKIAEHS